MNLLVAGYGSIGRRHAANLRVLHPASTIAVLRSGAAVGTPEALEGVDRVFYDVADAVAFRPDAAFVCTPAPFHVPLSRKLVEVGSHLFLEKPISHTLEGIKELEAAAIARDRVVLVGYTLAFLPAMRFLREFVQSGRIGQVLSVQAAVGQYLPDWRPGTDYRLSASARRDLGGGVLLELSHELHYLRWMLGHVRRVQATIRNTETLGIECEDLAALILEFETGAVGTLQLDFLQRSYSRTCRIIGTEGTVSWDGKQQKVIYHGINDTSGQVIFADDNTDNNRVYCDELRHFFSCIKRREKPLVTIEDAAAVLRMVLAARQAAQSGQVTHV